MGPPSPLTLSFAPLTLCFACGDESRSPDLWVKLLQGAWVRHMPEVWDREMAQPTQTAGVCSIPAMTVDVVVSY